jgi:hypothetical protein
VSDTWKKILQTVAPVIGAAWGGPLGGAVASTVSEKLLGKPGASESEIAQAVSTATPDVLMKLKEAEQAFTLQMRELDVDIEKINQADRASARERETKTGDATTPRFLAVLITLGFFGALGYLLHAGKPAGGDVLLVMIGALGSAWAGVVSYYFGSSVGSAEKTAILANRDNK